MADMQLTTALRNPHQRFLAGSLDGEVGVLCTSVKKFMKWEEWGGGLNQLSGLGTLWYTVPSSCSGADVFTIVRFR